ncbi:MAG: ArdC family protein [Planctomycetaceae bacterium]|nr:ArdC family protein [Planctomycetaceae bacterium]
MNRQDITNEIIKAMEKGTCPWRKTWSNFAHKNQFSGKCYHGINQLLLSLNEEAFPYWGTFMQWKDAECPVRKGEKSITRRLLYRREKNRSEGWRNKNSR